MYDNRSSKDLPNYPLSSYRLKNRKEYLIFKKNKFDKIIITHSLFPFTF
jgi:hypothetical protein